MNVGVLTMPVVPRWQMEALESVGGAEGVSLSHVVVDTSVDADSQIIKGASVIKNGRSVSMADLRLFTGVLWEERLKALLYADEKLGWLLFGESDRLEYLQTEPVASVESLQHATITECVPTRDGAWKIIPDEVVDELADRCEVVIRFGFGLLKGRMLSAPKHGVLSTHGSDIREYRGLGPRITFLRGEPMATVTLQQLSEELDGGKVVKIASTPLPKPRTLDDVWGAVYDLQTGMYATGIRRLRRPDFKPQHPDRLGEYFSHNMMRNDIGFVTHLLAKNNASRVRKALSESFG